MKSFGEQGPRGSQAQKLCPREVWDVSHSESINAFTNLKALGTPYLGFLWRTITYA